ncbi:hypothetical protein [Polaromonas sp. C04]|uniref:hypothetical protein n=1 Tax=Polaromonas sp. C04 TaxID=1945857 RepID=UPI001438E362|nr:hypothetical protein [Polaromonas sp. C04]
MHDQEAGASPVLAEFSLLSLFNLFFKLPSQAKRRSERSRVAGDSAARRSERGQQAAARARMVANRELVFKIVRDAMLLSEVLSGSYKFKVLSLSRKGNKFAVLMDTSAPLQGGPARQLDVESLVIRLAERRHGIIVTAMYWRSVDRQAALAAMQAPRATRVNFETPDALARVNAVEQSDLSSTNFGEIN